MRSRRPHTQLVRPFAPGYTLIELMVVVMIAILLMVVSLPVAKTVMESGRPREASRIVNTTLYTAKSKAASTGRLAGVEFVLEQAAAPGSYRCTQMYMCEVPALYMGDTTDARATVNNTGAITFMNGCAGSLPSLLGSGQVFEIRFNHRGLWYRVARSGYQIQNFGSQPAPPIGATGAIFQIRRAPVRVGNPVELPKSTAIDMTVSGIGLSGTEFSSLTASTPLQIMFAPAGNAYFPDGAPQGTIHLLVGLAAKVDATATTDPERSNLADGNALWVSVGRMSGVITTNENVPGSGLPAARQFATNREQQGGL
jgi:type II secretory pathway pseudopilin PulG